MARLIKKAGTYYCSECFMKQINISERCFFCGNIFLNYETTQLDYITSRATIDINSLYEVTCESIPVSDNYME